MFLDSTKTDPSALTFLTQKLSGPFRQESPLPSTKSESPDVGVVWVGFCCKILVAEFLQDPSRGVPRPLNLSDMVAAKGQRLSIDSAAKVETARLSELLAKFVEKFLHGAGKT